MSETAALPNRAKKGVGLSGVTAGNTALSSVGRSGNDLHYRGYDILEVADSCDFEEIAYLQAASKIRYAQGFYFSRPIFLDELKPPIRAASETRSAPASRPLQENRPAYARGDRSRR